MTYKTTKTSRTRARGGYKAPGYFRVWTVLQNGAIREEGGGYTCPLGKVEVMADIVTRPFKTLRDSGEIVMSPMNKATSEYESSSSGSSLLSTNLGGSVPGVTNNTTGDRLSVILWGAATTPAGATMRALPRPLSAVPASRAIAEACTKAASLQPNANLLVSMAEMHKTARLVPDLLHNWRSLFATLNGTRKMPRNYTGKPMQWELQQSLGKLSKLERSATETWLAMRFGVRPLIMDTLGVLKALSGSYDKDGKPVRVRTQGATFYSDSESVTYDILAGVTKSTVMASTTLDFHVRAMQLWEAHQDKLINSGISLAAIPEAAIDLVRFSFVVNWVVNVNSFFAALGTASDPGIVPLAGCYTVEKQHSTTFQQTGFESNDIRWSVGQPATGIATISVNSKYRVIGLNQPKLTVRTNPFKFLTDFRVVDALALLRVEMRGRGVRSLARISANSRYL